MTREELEAKALVICDASYESWNEETPTTHDCCGSCEFIARALQEAHDAGAAKANALLRGLIEDGPYCNDDGECSFCGFAPNDSEGLDHLICHRTNCKWRVGVEFLSAPAAEDAR